MLYRDVLVVRRNERVGKLHDGLMPPAMYRVVVEVADAALVLAAEHNYRPVFEVLVCVRHVTANVMYSTEPAG